MAKDPAADDAPRADERGPDDPVPGGHEPAAEGAGGDSDRRGLFGLGRDSGRAEVKELKQRIAELERTVAELRRRKDLAELDEVELTELASQTAVAMVRAAKARQDEAARVTEELLGDARTTASEIRSAAEADERLAAARAEADELVGQARQDAERLREEVDQLLARAQQDAEEARAAAEASAESSRQAAAEEAEATLADARSRAERIVQRAEEDATGIIEQAVSERDQLLEAVAREQRWVRGLLEQIAEVRQATAEAFGAVRQRLETATQALSAPTEEADDIGAELERGAGRLRDLTPASPDDDAPADSAPPTRDADAADPPDEPAAADAGQHSGWACSSEGDEGDSAVVRVWSGDPEGQGDDRR